jgi:hypothetical protein
MKRWHSIVGVILAWVLWFNWQFSPDTTVKHYSRDSEYNSYEDCIAAANGAAVVLEEKNGVYENFTAKGDGWYVGEGKTDGRGIPGNIEMFHAECWTEHIDPRR